MLRSLSTMAHWGRPDTSHRTRLHRAALCGALLIFLAGSAEAVSFASDVSVIGTSAYDTLGVQEIGVANVEGALRDTVGGVASQSEFNGAIVNGPNPRAALMTDIGDSIGAEGTGLASTPGAFRAAIDLGLQLSNASATESYRVEIELTFLNAVFSGGGMGTIDSTFTLLDTRGGSFETSVLSSTAGANMVGAVTFPSIGGLVEDSGVAALSYRLDPGEHVDLTGEWRLEGDALGDQSLVILDGFDLSLRVAGVTQVSSQQPVPEPAAALCFGLGLGVAALRRFTRRT